MSTYALALLEDAQSRRGRRSHDDVVLAGQGVHPVPTFGGRLGFSPTVGLVFACEGRSDCSPTLYVRDPGRLAERVRSAVRFAVGQGWSL
jgi:hypothetical protein